MKEIRPDLPVYLYCQSGMRSGRAAQTLYKKGYSKLYHLKVDLKNGQVRVKLKKSLIGKRNHITSKTNELDVACFYCSLNM